jgi:hypothetical protein
MNFSISNITSINLNFIIYYLNLYDNYFNNSTRFPWIDIDRNYLLGPDEIEIKLKEVWNSIINTYDLSQNDFEYWRNNKFYFEDLLKNKPQRTEILEYIKKTYVHWYWGCGNQLCNIFSDNLVEKYYRNLVKFKIDNSINFKGQMFYLHTVYSAQPNDWESIKGDIIIISPDKPLPSTEAVAKICIL